MSQRHLMSDMLSPCYKENNQYGMGNRKGNNDFMPRSLTFEDDDSRDSGFESQDSENEVSPSTATTRSIDCVLEVRSHGTRRSLFSGKRSHDDDNIDVYSKKPRMNEIRAITSTLEQEVTTELMKTAVDRMNVEFGLIGDGSQKHRLPTVSGRHNDLKSVSPNTISQLLEGKFDDVISGYQIIDCRFPYEYEGGHIKGAKNLHTESMITDFITRQHSSDSTSRNILIFHCEFSSERGPKLLRHLRNMDRKLNCDRYPFLFYPEVYLLDRGYKAFYEQNRFQCEPRNYVPMLHENFSKQLRHFRVKSKSWTAGEKQSKRSRLCQMTSSPVKMPLF